MAVRLERTSYSDYPKRLTVSIPIDEVPFPPTVKESLPYDTTHVKTVIFLRDIPEGKEGFREFWEQHVPKKRETAPMISFAGYQEALDELRVPQQPEEELWTPLENFWVPEHAERIITEQYNGEPHQGRVTTYVQRGGPVEGLSPILRGQTVAGRLYALGFPADSFSHLPETGIPRPIVDLLDSVQGRRHGHLKHTVRTNRQPSQPTK